MTREAFPKSFFSWWWRRSSTQISVRERTRCKANCVSGNSSRRTKKKCFCHLFNLIACQHYRWCRSAEVAEIEKCSVTAIKVIFGGLLTHSTPPLPSQKDNNNNSVALSRIPLITVQPRQAGRANTDCFSFIFWAERTNNCSFLQLEFFWKNLKPLRFRCSSRLPCVLR